MRMNCGLYDDVINLKVFLLDVILRPWKSYASTMVKMMKQTYRLMQRNIR